MKLCFQHMVRCKACSNPTMIANLVVVELEARGPFFGYCSCDTEKTRALVSFDGKLRLNEKFAELVQAAETAKEAVA